MTVDMSMIFICWAGDLLYAILYISSTIKKWESRCKIKTMIHYLFCISERLLASHIGGTLDTKRQQQLHTSLYVLTGSVCDFNWVASNLLRWSLLQLVVAGRSPFCRSFSNFGPLFWPHDPYDYTPAMFTHRLLDIYDRQSALNYRKKSIDFLVHPITMTTVLLNCVQCVVWCVDLHWLLLLTFFFPGTHFYILGCGCYFIFTNIGIAKNNTCKETF